jgi:alpha,alpha-trehalose-phosphate synthase [UDP-forming]
MNQQDKRLVIVSNRLPIVIGQEEESWRIAPGAGGLITALAPVMRRNSGLWVGWPGCGEEAPLEELFARFNAEQGYQLAPVPLSEEQVEKYYQGFSNETLWPLFHDLLGYCRFQTDTWQAYQEVNARFAEVLLAHSRPGDVTWIHDYQLLLVGQALKQLGMQQSLGFFLHIPFPSPDLYRRLPWRDEIIRAMLAYDLIGFQTLRDRRNFVACATSLLPDTEVISRHRHYTLVRSGERFVKVGHYPISIDFAEFNDAACSQEVAEAAWYLHEQLEERQLLLGIDRLDYTKGIPDRFLAFERALEKYPDLHKRISLLQVVVPSRTLVADYQDLKELLDQVAGRINARFSEPGWTPIYYVFRSLERMQLLAHYRASEIALVTPLRDGMNLVAKEYCAASVDGNSVLILSEFAGAADELGRGALLVNPYDVEATADAIHQAFLMSHPERQRRMKMLQSEIRRHDVHLWLRRFMEHLAGGASFA